MSSQDAKAKTADSLPADFDELTAAFEKAASAAECLILAAEAERLNNSQLQRRCLERAVSLDRNCQTALLILAAITLDEGDRISAAVLLDEAARAAPLPKEVEPLYTELFAELEWNAECDTYLRLTARRGDTAPLKPLRIVLLTNLFPPQELGGYGRMMWEFANGLLARGHSVRILTSNAAAFSKTPVADEVALESHVMRTLELAGTWVAGRGVALTNETEIHRQHRDNLARTKTIINKFKPDFVLVGNLDFLGCGLLQHALDRSIPVLHAVANALPGFAPAQQPTDAHYWMAPCSDWNGAVLRQAGFAPQRMETLYPGARVDRFFRFFLPDTSALRICYASLVMPYKGADTLIEALVALHAAGVAFTAEIAGEAPDANFLAGLKERVVNAGMEHKVSFTGFLDRTGLRGLFARSNVLVFPSRFEEPFGITQVEALAAGLVVVSSATGGAKEVVRDGIDGLLFSAGNVDQLSRQLQRLVTEPKLMGSLQASGQARAALFTVDKAVIKIEELAAEMKTAIELANSTVDQFA